MEKSRLKLQWWQILDGSCYRLCKKQLQVLSAAKGSEGQCMDERQWRRLEMATIEVGLVFQFKPNRFIPNGFGLGRVIFSEQKDDPVELYDIYFFIFCIFQVKIK